MGDTRNSILSLLALAHAESLPALSFADICALLPMTGEETITQEKIRPLLLGLEKELVVFSHGEWYALKKTPDNDALQKRAELTRRKISRNRFFFSLMQMIPFVEASAITGSVSMGNANDKSDIDILCVIARGRIWTARALLLLLAEFFGKRREKGYALDKLCFNCFTTKDALFPLRNIASAHMLARALPLFGTETLDAFFNTNAWTRDHVSRASASPIVASSRALRAIAHAAAWILSGIIGNTLERALMRWQIRRLRKKVEKGSDSSGLILLEDVVTLYYPDSKNKIIMSRYAEALQ
jgi:predicted nucleotidyltransferase